MSQTIESYLISLGFEVKTPELQKFNQTLAEVNKAMTTTVGKLGGEFFKLQFALTSGVLAIGAASVAAISSFADFDKSMKLGAMGAFMTQSAFTSLNEALKMTGVSLAEASWSPEFHQRTLENLQLVNKLQEALGPNAAENARKIRDFQNQFKQLGEELKFLKLAAGEKIFEKVFGDEKSQEGLKKFNEWLLKNIPEISDKIANDIGRAVHWIEDLAKSIDHLDTAVKSMDFTKLTKADWKHLGEAGLILAGLGGGAAATAVGGGKILKSVLGFGEQRVFVTNWPGSLGSFLKGGTAAAEGAAGAEAGAGTGLAAAVPIVGTAVAGALALNDKTQGTWWGGYDLSSWGAFKAQLMGTEQTAGTGSGSGTVSASDHLSNLAAAISAKTGIKAELLFGQLMAESGKGTSRIARDLHNYSGVKIKGKDEYRDFGTDAAYITYLSKMFTDKKYSATGMLAAQNASEYATDLKKAGYYEDSISNYRRNIEHYQGGYRAPGGGDITINGPLVSAKTDANPQDIARVVKDSLTDLQAKNGRFGQAAGNGGWQ